MEASLKHRQDDSRNTRPVYVSKEWHKRLRQLAAERDVRIGILVEEAILAYLESERVSRKKSK